MQGKTIPFPACCFGDRSIQTCPPSSVTHTRLFRPGETSKQANVYFGFLPGCRSGMRRESAWHRGLAQRTVGQVDVSEHSQPGSGRHLSVVGGPKEESASWAFRVDPRVPRFKEEAVSSP